MSFMHLHLGIEGPLPEGIDVSVNGFGPSTLAIILEHRSKLELGFPN